MDNSVYKALCQQAYGKMDKGEFREAVRIVFKIRSLENKIAGAFFISALLTDIGSAILSKRLVEIGIKLLEQNLDSLLSEGYSRRVIYYNLGNSYKALHSFKRRQDPHYGYLAFSELNEAKKNYHESLNSSMDSQKAQDPQCWVNLGNCYDEESRTVEALECYDKALELDPKHAMAKGNKGIALSYYAELTDTHEGTFLNEAYHLLESALELGTPHEARSYFKKEANLIQRIMEFREIPEDRPTFPGIDDKRENKAEESLIKFCLEKKLYLNICSVCQQCDAAVGDTLGIKSMIISLKESSYRKNEFNKFASVQRHSNLPVGVN